MELAIALYAAVVATLSVGWQIYTHRRKGRSIVKVAVGHENEREQFIAGYAEDVGGGPFPWEYKLTVIAVNKGDTVEHVERLGLETATGRELDASEWKEDRRLEPKARVTWAVRVNHLPDKTIEGAFYGFAQLASGARARSSSQHLRADLLERVGTREG